MFLTQTSPKILGSLWEYPDIFKANSRNNSSKQEGQFDVPRFTFFFTTFDTCLSSPEPYLLVPPILTAKANMMIYIYTLNLRWVLYVIYYVTSQTKVY